MVSQSSSTELVFCSSLYGASLTGEAAWRTDHGDNEHARAYRAAVEFAHAIHAIILPEAAK